MKPIQAKFLTGTFFHSIHELAQKGKPLFGYDRTVYYDPEFNRIMRLILRKYLTFARMNFVPDQLNAPDEYFEIAEVAGNPFSEEVYTFLVNFVAEAKEQLLENIFEIAFDYYSERSGLDRSRFLNAPVYVDVEGNKYVTVHLNREQAFLLSADDVEQTVLVEPNPAAGRPTRIVVPVGIRRAGGIQLFNDPVQKHLGYIERFFHVNGFCLYTAPQNSSSFRSEDVHSIMVYIPVNF